MFSESSYILTLDCPYIYTTCTYIHVCIMYILYIIIILWILNHSFFFLLSYPLVYSIIIHIYNSRVGLSPMTVNHIHRWKSKQILEKEGLNIL